MKMCVWNVLYRRRFNCRGSLSLLFITGLLFTFQVPSLGSEEKVLICTEHSENPLPMSYEVIKEGDKYFLVKKLGERILITHPLFVSGDSSAINGYGGTYFYLHDLGRSGFAMIYFHKTSNGDTNEKSISLIDINLFQSDSRMLNTQGPQTHFVCDTPNVLAVPCEETLPYLTDVTHEFSYRGSVISAFPQNYAQIPKEENADIIKSFKISRHPSCPAFERRIEVFYTGGDWMKHGVTYLVTDAPNKTHHVPDEKAAAYFMSDLSTSDLEMGETPPKINPRDDLALKDFITHLFLDRTGNVNPEFVPLKTAK